MLKQHTDVISAECNQYWRVPGPGLCDNRGQSPGDQDVGLACVYSGTGQDKEDMAWHTQDLHELGS